MKKFIQTILDIYRSTVTDAIEKFNKFDDDKSGSLDTDELGKLMTKMGIEIDDDGMQKCLQEIDEDGSGSVSMEEFIQWFLKIDSQSNIADEYFNSLG